MLLRVAGFVFLLIGCGLTAAAQEPVAPEAERRAELDRLQNRRRSGPGEQREIYELGKEYLRKYGDRPLGEADAQIAAYIRRWVARYELALEKYARRVLPETHAGPRPVCRRSDTLRGLSSKR